MKEYCVRRSSVEQWEKILKAESAHEAACLFGEEVELSSEDGLIVVENLGRGKGEKLEVSAAELGVAVLEERVISEAACGETSQSRYEKSLERTRRNTCYGFLRTVLKVIFSLKAVVLIVFGAAGAIDSLNSGRGGDALIYLLYALVGVPLLIAAYHCALILIDIADTLIQQREDRSYAE